jgi:AraC-like DNA-binding protein
MELNTHAPGPPLDRFIDSLIHYRRYRPDHARERVVPDGHMYLIFELDGAPRYTHDNETLDRTATFTRAWISGMQTRYITISTVQDSSMFIVRFRPGGAYPFLNVPLDTLADRVVAADSVSDGVDSLRSSLVAASTPRDAFAATEVWLGHRFQAELVPPESIQEAVRRITADPVFVATDLASLVADSGYSRKHFIHLFRRYVGLTPKYFQRVMRFSEILPRVIDEEEVSWTRVSYECGYYDQAHFIREFVHFSGYNPAAFLRGASDRRVNFFPVGP